jgi:protein-tyrosine phosphatase
VTEPADPAQLHERARRVGIAEADLPRRLPHPDRRLPLEGGLNFRDLGGYPTQDGSVTRWGTLFRSDHLNTLTDADLADIAALGLQRVHDFRLQKERDRQPSRLPDGEAAPEVRHLGAADLGVDETMVDVVIDMLSGKRELPAPTYWDDNYDDMVERSRPMFCALITSIGEDEGAGLPSLFHCTGGKDRTGLAGVIVLELLGVDRETAIDDFLLTNLYRTPVRAEALAAQLEAVGITVPAALPILGVTRSAIERALAAIDDRHGGVERYVVDGGCDPQAVRNLRRLLVERGPAGDPTP